MGDPTMAEPPDTLAADNARWRAAKEVAESIPDERMRDLYAFCEYVGWDRILRLVARQAAPPSEPKPDPEK